MLTTVVSPFKFAGGSAPTARINGSAETDQGTSVAAPVESVNISGAEADTKSASTHTRLGQFARTGALVGLALAGIGAVEGLAPTLAAAEPAAPATATICNYDGVSHTGKHRIVEESDEDIAARVREKQQRKQRIAARVRDYDRVFHTGKNRIINKTEEEEHIAARLRDWQSVFHTGKSR